MNIYAKIQSCLKVTCTVINNFLKNCNMRIMCKISWEVQKGKKKKSSKKNRT